MAPEFDKLEAEREALGATAQRVIEALDDSDVGTAWHGFATLAKTRGFASGKALKEAMGREGVRGRPEIGFAVEMP